jgi:hypothetical protein
MKTDICYPAGEDIKAKDPTALPEPLRIVIHLRKAFPRLPLETDSHYIKVGPKQYRINFWKDKTISGSTGKEPFICRSLYVTVDKKADGEYSYTVKDN